MKWFGKSWGAPICRELDHTDTPVGRTCLHCYKPILHTDCGVTMPFAGGPTPEAVYHHHCLMESMGLDKFPPGYGANYRKPVIKLAHASLKLDDPEESDFRAVCPVCGLGVLRVQRDQQTLELVRNDYCSKCVQRFWYTDDTIAGEALPPQ